MAQTGHGSGGLLVDYLLVLENHFLSE